MASQVDIITFLRRYVNENRRGCPKGVLVHIGGYKTADIDKLSHLRIIESQKGMNGGYYITGENPKQQKPGISLKARMVQYLKTLDTIRAKVLVDEYESEMAKRGKR